MVTSHDDLMVGCALCCGSGRWPSMVTEFKVRGAIGQAGVGGWILTLECQGATTVRLKLGGCATYMLGAG
jgi:hypothetical protein